MIDTYFIPARAHEGCVWIPETNRLYFSTTKQLPATDVSLQYLDFSDYDLGNATDWAERLAGSAVESLSPQTLVADANMANSFCRDGAGHLLVCEQGTQDTLARISRVSLRDGSRTVVTDHFDGEPFNSPNKVLRTRAGHIVFSDPDYGFRQGFRPPPVREPALYVLPSNGAPYAFDCNLEMPHGLALSPDETSLFVTDTSADGAHDGVDLDRRRAVFRFDFDPASGRIAGSGEHCFSVDEGVPDGSITHEDRLLVGGGDGVYLADPEGQLLGKIPLKHTAVNLCVAGPGGRHLFVTADAGVYLLLDWGGRVSEWIADPS